MCERCYNRRHKTSRWATCHPDRPHHARGLCEPCYRGAQNRRRDARLATSDYHSQEEWEALVAQYSFCPRCKRPWSIAGEPTRDHAIPVSRGGNDTINNLQPLCYSCNSGKGDRIAFYAPDMELAEGGASPTA